MEARIRQLTATLTDAEIVDGATLPDTTVATGSIVAIRYEGDDEIERFLVGSIEERNDGAERGLPRLASRTGPARTLSR